MNILSIQSHVAYGHVGNAVATFALQRMGVEVWPVHTVQFSNHTGYGAWTGQVFDGAAIREVVRGIEARGVFGSCDGLLSGYMGSADIGSAILDTAAKVKGANAKALWCCDPVIGNAERGIFVRDGVAEFIRERAIAAADIVTPNHFELDYLSGQTSATMQATLAALKTVHALGPRAILVTSLRVAQTPPDAIDLLASGPDGQFTVRTPKLDVPANGAGDAIAALFFAHYLRAASTRQALSLATSAVFGVLSKTAVSGTSEIQLIAAQDEIVRPTRLFAAEPVSV